MRGWSRYLVCFLSVAVLVSVHSISCASPAPGAKPSEPQAEQVTQRPAQFEISAINVTSDKVIIDIPANVVVTVKNIGDLAGTYNATLTVDNEVVAQKDIQLAGGETQEVSFEVTKSESGTYQLEIGEASAQLIVHGWQPYTIQYDDGEPSSWVTWTTYGPLGMALRCTPEYTSFRIEQISINGYGMFESDSERDERQFKVSIWNQDMSERLWSELFPWNLFEMAASPKWVDLPVPNVIVNGDFYVEFIPGSNLATGNYRDNMLLIWCWKGDGEGRSTYIKNDTLTPKTGQAQSLNWCIRVKGEGP